MHAWRSAPGIADEIVQIVTLQTSKRDASPDGQFSTLSVRRSDEPAVSLKVDGESVTFKWGLYWAFGSAAYWAAQYNRRAESFCQNQAFGEDLLEETAACLLGGHGVPGEIGIAAFRAVQSAGLLKTGQAIRESEFFAVLQNPITVRSENLGKSTLVRYRFARQRSWRLARLTELFAEAVEPPKEPRLLREWLLKISGVGYKTASWIVRNYTGCDQVAVIDIHVHRAGRLAGFFPPHWRLRRDYLRFEEAFVRFAELSGARTSVLDALMWHDMRVLGSGFRTVNCRPTS